jgi:hypothetical protein
MLKCPVAVGVDVCMLEFIAIRRRDVRKRHQDGVYECLPCVGVEDYLVGLLVAGQISDPILCTFKPIRSSGIERHAYR